MSFLTPFYLLAGLAIGLPIYFHLIRRAPQGRQLFGTVMFLSPTPPQTTRRSRIQDWLLLILRSLAVLLIALAFARPFFVSRDSVAAVPVTTRQFVFALDHSASMTRENCWEQALQSLNEQLQDLSPSDRVAVIAFADRTQTLIDFDDWDELPPAARTATISEKLQSLTPDWQGTQAGHALVTACELLTGSEAQQKSVILISDLASGGGWESLSQFVWPDDVTLRISSVQPADVANAGLHQTTSGETDPRFVRVRVMNTPSATNDVFQLTWSPLRSTQGPLTTADSKLRAPSGNADTEQKIEAAENTSISIVVPPGESRIMNLKLDPEKSLAPQYLTLTGDQPTFDNQITVATLPKHQLKIVALDSDEATSGVNNPFYFLSAALPSTDFRDVQLMTKPATDDWTPDGTTTADWLLIGGSLNESRATAIRQWIETGKSVLFLLRNSEQSKSLFTLLDLPVPNIEEASVNGYRLWQDIDFSHPAFQQFDAPMYSDFSKIHFQKYRVLPADSLPGLRKIVTFDNGDLALGEVRLGEGRVLFMTSTWARDESDLAVSSKFVPLLNAFLDDASPQNSAHLTKHVGEQIQLRELGFPEPVSTFVVRVASETDSQQITGPYQFTRPGLHEFAESSEFLNAGQKTLVNVSVPSQESQTEPISEAFFESLNIPFSPLTSSSLVVAVPDENNERLILNAELESQQRLWQWILCGVLALLLIESVAATLRRLKLQHATT